MRTEEQAACEQTILRIGAVGASVGAVVSVAGIGLGNLTILNGTWPSVHSYFHGVPFILSEVACSQRYSAWLGCVGVVGGAAGAPGAACQW